MVNLIDALETFVKTTRRHLFLTGSGNSPFSCGMGRHLALVSSGLGEQAYFGPQAGSCLKLSDFLWNSKTDRGLCAVDFGNSGTGSFGVGGLGIYSYVRGRKEEEPFLLQGGTGAVLTMHHQTIDFVLNSACIFSCLPTPPKTRRQTNKQPNGW